MLISTMDTFAKYTAGEVICLPHGDSFVMKVRICCELPINQIYQRYQIETIAIIPIAAKQTELIQ